MAQVKPIEFTPESWMFDEDGNLLREADFVKAMNEHWRQQYAGLSRPVVGEEIWDIPEPRWALRNLIQEFGLTMIHGSPGSGKSLMAMDWAYTLAHPKLKEWMGQPKAKTLRPMYVFTEGLSGLMPRSKAWTLSTGKGIPTGDSGVVWVRDSVRLNRTNDPERPWTEQVAALVRMYNDYNCNILFVDTLANTFGGDENSQEDANNYLAALRLFQEGGPVVIVHHNVKGGKDYRGSTVLEGAVDTKVGIENKEGIVELRITKQKDGDPTFFLPLVMKVMAWEGQSGQELTSVVFERNTEYWMNESDQETLQVLEDLGTATTSEMAEALDVARQTAESRLQKLLDHRKVTHDDGRPRVWSLVDYTPETAEEL